jgi:glycosyltransferase involved in cell wall biosynthesis
VDLKVLHLDTSREWRGGQQQVLYLTRGLEERGIVSVVAAPQGSPLAQRLRKQDLSVIELPPGAVFAPRVVRALQQILADRRWNVLHAHTANAHTLGFLAFRLPAPRSFIRPSFVISRRVDFVPARDPLTRLKYTTGDQTIVCVSAAIRAILEQYGVTPHALRVVRSGVQLPGVRIASDPLPSELRPNARDEERLELRSELEVPADAILLGNIAQLVEHKGHTHLLEAMALVAREEARAHLVLLGNGDLEKDLRRQAERLELNGRVTFAGYRPDAARYLPAMDLFVMSSVEEGLGTSMLDAQAAGVPVVATRSGGIPEAIHDGVTGRIVPPAQPAEMARAIVALLRDPDLRSRMGRAGRTWIEEGFTADRMIDETLAVYREVIGRS